MNSAALPSSAPALLLPAPNLASNLAPSPASGPANPRPGATPFLSAPPPGTESPSPSAGPDAMIYSDIDDTFLATGDAGLPETRQALQAHAGETVNALCTGRGLGQVLPLAERLGAFPLQFIGVNNGLFVYHNDQGLPANEFLAGLQPSKADPDWTAEIARRTHGWLMGTVLATMLDVVKEKGFQPAPPSGQAFNLDGEVDGEPLRVSYYLDQPSFTIANPETGLTPHARATGDAIAAQIETLMAAREIQSTHYVINDHDRKAIYGFQPPGIDKKALLEFELERYPSVRAVITAGDNVNDTHLPPPAYGDVLNYRILAGDHHPQGDELARQERVLRCPSGELAAPIEAHLATIAATAPHPS